MGFMLWRAGERRYGRNDGQKFLATDIVRKKNGRVEKKDSTNCLGKLKRVNAVGQTNTGNDDTNASLRILQLNGASDYHYATADFEEETPN